MGMEVLQSACQLSKLDDLSCRMILNDLAISTTP